MRYIIPVVGVIVLAVLVPYIWGSVVAWQIADVHLVAEEYTSGEHRFNGADAGKIHWHMSRFVILWPLIFATVVLTAMTSNFEPIAVPGFLVTIAWYISNFTMYTPFHLKPGVYTRDCSNYVHEHRCPLPRYEIKDYELGLARFQYVINCLSPLLLFVIIGIAQDIREYYNPYNIP